MGSGRPHGASLGQVGLCVVHIHTWEIPSGLLLTVMQVTPCLSVKPMGGLSTFRSISYMPGMVVSVQNGSLQISAKASEGPDKPCSQTVLRLGDKGRSRAVRSLCKCRSR